MSKLSSFKIRIMLVLLIATVSPGCSSSVETVELKPVLIDQDCTASSHKSEEVWCPDLNPVGTGFYGVVEPVKQWVAGEKQNWGFIIEPSRAFTAQYSDSRCLESLTDLKLTVKYRVKKSWWPGH